MMNLDTLEQNPVYRELVTELKICRGSGIFLSLYRDKEVINMVGAKLERNLPEYLFMPVEADAGHTRIAAILEQNKLRTNEKNSIFHIIETQKPTDNFRRDFIDYLLYTKQRFQNRPYTMVFWVTPKFEKELFFVGSDLYNLITGTYDFTGLDPELSGASRKTKALLKQTNHTSITIPQEITGYLSTVIHQFDHWKDTNTEQSEFLLKSMQSVDYQALYQPTNALDKTGQTTPLFDILDQRLNSSQINYLTITGETRFDRTACLINYYIHLARNFIENREFEPMPLFISLQDHQHRISLNELVLKEFYQRFGIQVSTGIFQQLARQGRLVFLVDGLEQMNVSSNYKLTLENLKTLTKLSLTNLKSKTQKDSAENLSNKVLLTCSPHFIYDQWNPLQEVQENQYTRLFMTIAGKPDHEFIRIVNPIFNTTVIEELIRRISIYPLSADSLLKICQDQAQIQEIANEQLILSMIRQVLFSEKTDKETNIADLYHQYVSRWIDNDDWRTILKPEGKRAFMWELALKMIKTKNNYRINARRIEQPKRSLLKETFKNHIFIEKTNRLNYYREEAGTCPFLILDANGNYIFIHKSFVEFFLADYYFHCIKNRTNRQISYAAFNNNMKFFLKMIICNNRHNLEKIDLCGVNLDYIELDGASLKSAKLQRTQLNYASLAGADFEDADLTRTSLRKANLQQAKMARAKMIQTDLTEADLTGADLTEADLQRSRLSEADLSKVILKNAKLNDVDMTSANFQEADLTGADLRWSSLQRASFRSANISEARLLHSNCHEADFSQACLQRANLNSSDLTRTVFYQADMKYVNLNKANLYESNLSQADLTRANLQKANLQRADFQETIMRKTNLIKTDMRWANLHKTDMSEADLWQANLNEADISEAIYDIKDLEKAYSDGIKKQL